MAHTMQDMTNDRDEESDEEVHGARSGRVQSRGAVVPVGVGYPTVLAGRSIHQPSSSLNPYFGDFDQLLIQSPVCLPSLKDGEWDGKFHTSNVVTSPHPTQEPYFVPTKDVPRDPANSRGFRSSVSGTTAKEQKSLFLSSRKL